MRFAGKVRYEEFTLPSGDTVLFRPLTADEAADLGVGRNGQEMTGAQIRSVICRACREPKFVDTEDVTDGQVSIYALDATDEVALLKQILDRSYGKMALQEVPVPPESFPAGGRTPSSDVRPDAPPSDGATSP